VFLALLLALATPHWATINGHKLYYETFGHGRPLLLLHGGGNTVEGSFSKQLDAFAKSHTIIGPEQVGHGHTPDAAGPLTYGGMADDTAALLDQLKLKDVDVVGWSDGGNIALILAVRRPDLVRRIVVSGANFSPEGLPASDLAGLRAADEHPPASLTALDRKLTHMWATSPTPAELSPGLLTKIAKPVIVMAGDHDAITLEHTIALYRALPHGRLCILPDTNHGTFINRPEWVNQIAISFFAEP